MSGFVFDIERRNENHVMFPLSADLILKVCWFAITQPHNVCGSDLLLLDTQTFKNLRLTSKFLQYLIDEKVSRQSFVQESREIILRMERSWKDQLSLVPLPVTNWKALRWAASKILVQFPPEEWVYGVVGTSFPLTVFMSLLNPKVQCCHLLSTNHPLGDDVFPEDRTGPFAIPKRAKNQLAVASIADVNWEVCLKKKKLLVLDWCGGEDLLTFFHFLKGLELDLDPMNIASLEISEELICPTSQGTLAYLDTILWLAAHFFGANQDVEPPVTEAPYKTHLTPIFLTLPEPEEEPEPKFGTEMTFSEPGWVNTKDKGRQITIGIGYRKKWVKAFLEHIQGFLGPTGIQLGDESEGVDILSKENHPQLDLSRALVGCPSADWYYQVTIDHNVLELKTKPMTMKEVERLGRVLVNTGGTWKSKDVIQEFIFDVGKSDEVGLVPQDVTGAGHIHIDIKSAFLHNPVMLLNFMTDIHNIGVWPFYPLSQQFPESAPLCLVEGAKQAYKKLILGLAKEMEGHDFSFRDERRCLVLIGDIRTHVYTKCLNQFIMTKEPSNIKKYQTLCLEKVGITVEIRSMRPQHFARELRLLLRLLHNRIVFATNRKELVQLNVPQFPKKKTLSEQALALVAERFIRYALEARVDPADYVEFMPPDVAEAVRKLLSM